MRRTPWFTIVIMGVLIAGCQGTSESNTDPVAHSDGFASDMNTAMSDVGSSEIDGGVVPDAGSSSGGCIPDRSQWDQEVQAQVTTYCGDCHGGELQFGAIGHLTDYDTLLAGDSGMRLVDKIAGRLADGSMPPAAQDQPGSSLRLAIADWATCGAWSVNNATAPNPGGFDADKPILDDSGQIPEGTDFFELRADRFNVTPNMRDRYECFHFEAPITEERFIRRIETVVDDSRVLHHAILIPESDSEPGSHDRCQDDNPLSLIYGWAPGQGALAFPEGGMRIRPGQRFALQIHYNNGGRYPDVFDSSGVRIYHGPVEGPEVAMLTLGPIGFSVPANTTEVVTGWCRVPVDTKILYSFPHMHEFGTAFSQVVEKPSGMERSIISLNGWDFGSQYIYDTPQDIPAGTVIRTSCTYQNSTDGPIVFGPNTADEMCFNFAYISPPLPITYCNQNDQPIELIYEAGECAAPGAELVTADPVYAPFIQGVIEPLTGGDTPTGLWRVSAADIYLEQLSFAGVELDPNLSRVTALGTVGFSDGKVYFDALAEIQVVAGGLSFNSPLPISFSGVWTASEDDPGAFTMALDCGELLSEGDMRFGYDQGELMLRLPTTFGPVSLEFLVRLEPVSP